MKIGVVKESFPGERRVALVPADVGSLAEGGLRDCDRGGCRVGGRDQPTRIIGRRSRDRRGPGSDFSGGRRVRRALGGGEPLVVCRTERLLRPDLLLIGTVDPLGGPAGDRGIRSDRRPVVWSRVDSPDHACSEHGRPLLDGHGGRISRRAAGRDGIAEDVSPDDDGGRLAFAGAGVSLLVPAWRGCRRSRPSRRLGAVVQAYDVRPAVREQCESLGAKFVELPLETESAEGQGGYARAMDEDFYRRQRELMARVVAESDVVITTAAIPGKPSPRLITAEAVAGMQPGSVIVDLAAERGGNCELTVADERVVQHGVTLLGPTNLPAEVPYHASQMFAKNVATFLAHLLKDGQHHTGCAGRNHAGDPADPTRSSGPSAVARTAGSGAAFVAGGGSPADRRRRNQASRQAGEVKSWSEFDSHVRNGMTFTAGRVARLGPRRGGSATC